MERSTVITSLKDILNDLVFGMIYPIQVYKCVQQDAITLRFYVDKTSHAEVGRTFQIGAVTYTIKSVHYTYPVYIETENAAIPAFPTTFNLYPAVFYHGTPQETNTEISQITKADIKTPMVWMMESFDENDHLDPEDPHERESNVRIFFLTQGDFSKLTDEIHNLYVKPMHRLAEQFIAEMKAAYNIFEIWDQDFKTTDYNKFGVFINMKGVVNQLFVDELSGCEINISFKILKRGNCCQPSQDVIYLADENGVVIGTENGIPITIN